MPEDERGVTRRGVLGATAGAAAALAAGPLGGSRAASAQVSGVAASDVEVATDDGELDRITVDPRLEIEWSGFDEQVGAVFLAAEGSLQGSRHRPIFRATPWVTDVGGIRPSSVSVSGPGTSGHWRMGKPLSVLMAQSRAARGNDGHPLYRGKYRPLTLADRAGFPREADFPLLSWPNEEQQGAGTDVAEAGAVRAFADVEPGSGGAVTVLVDGSRFSEAEPAAEPYGAVAVLFDANGDGTPDFQAETFADGAVRYKAYDGGWSAVEPGAVPIAVTRLDAESEPAALRVAVEPGALSEGARVGVNNSRGGEGVGAFCSTNPDGLFTEGFGSSADYVPLGERPVFRDRLEEAYHQWRVGNSIGDTPGRLVGLTEGLPDPKRSALSLPNHYPGAAAGSYGAAAEVPPPVGEDGATEAFPASVRYTVEVLRPSLGQAASLADGLSPGDLEGLTPEQARAEVARSSCPLDAGDVTAVTTSPEGTLRGFELYQHLPPNDGDPELARTLTDEYFAGEPFPGTTRALPVLQAAAADGHPAVAVSEVGFDVEVTNREAGVSVSGGT